jgi:hypothetical protein
VLWSSSKFVKCISCITQHRTRHRLQVLLHDVRSQLMGTVHGTVTRFRPLHDLDREDEEMDTAKDNENNNEDDMKQDNKDDMKQDDEDDMKQDKPEDKRKKIDKRSTRYESVCLMASVLLLKCVTAVSHPFQSCGFHSLCLTTRQKLRPTPCTLYLLPGLIQRCGVCSLIRI